MHLRYCSFLQQVSFPAVTECMTEYLINRVITVLCANPEVRKALQKDFQLWQKNFCCYFIMS